MRRKTLISEREKFQEKNLVNWLKQISQKNLAKLKTKMSINQAQT